MTLLRLWAFAGCLAFAIGSNMQSLKVFAQGDPPQSLGSTLTVEQLRNPSQAKDKLAVPTIRVVPTAEADPALKIRFAPGPYELRPGSALLHFSRAILMMTQLPADLHKRVDSATPEAPASKEDLSELVDRSRMLFKELHALGFAEDQRWDHRLRDIQELERWAYLLPDVQEGRALARLLVHRVDVSLQRNDLNDAVEAVQDGFRLAWFMSQGETIIQQLVGLAIDSIMLDATERIIAHPQSPNFYWAIASMHDLQPQMRRAFELELGAIQTTFKAISDAAVLDGDEEYWQKRALEMQEVARQLSGDNSAGLNMSIALIVSSASAEEKLRSFGVTQEKLQSMSRTQMALLQADKEIRHWCDELAKELYLPQSSVRNADQFSGRRLDEWMKKNQHSSVGAVAMRILSPSFDGVRRAIRVNQNRRSRLMLIEALRAHAAAHNGQLPNALDQLSPLPAPPSSALGQPWQYRVAESPEGPTAEVTLDHADLPQFRKFRVTLTVAKANP